MKAFLVYILFLVSFFVSAQSDELAKEYFSKGEFDKALVAYEELHKSAPGNLMYFSRLVACHQELQQYDKAGTLLEQRMGQRNSQPTLLVEMGYNYQLQNNKEKAEEYYQQAIAKVVENVNYSSGVAYTFEQKSLLEKALQVYDLAGKQSDRFNFDFQKARIYGQLGDIEKMIDSYLDYASSTPTTMIVVQQHFSMFMNEDDTFGFSDLLRKALLVRAQKTQEVMWNEFLSWFFVQQKQYDRAFVQEKAVFKRFPDSFEGLMNLADLTFEEENYGLTTAILNFILENSQDMEVQIFGQTYLTEIRIKTAESKDYPLIKTEIKKLLTDFGKNPYTVDLQILQARFTGFNLDNPQQAQQILHDILKLPLNVFQQAEIKMELADMLLYEEKYNQALIYYSQIETDLKNHEIGHQASLKVAKTSYYKGDFPWALKQLSVLKTSFSQLIANDALELHLLINDNKGDSLYTALNKFAKADFYLYKNKKDLALNQFEQILQQHKGEDIEAVTHLRIGEILEKQQDYLTALLHYETIITSFPDGIYLDEALFFSAEIYNKHLANPEKAKELYEKVIFNHQDSIYFIEARKQYRILRGDEV
ncbi:MAG: tetratricopeptide repeat protein [Flavobacteriaceae bacterium]